MRTGNARYCAIFQRVSFHLLPSLLEICCQMKKGRLTKPGKKGSPRVRAAQWKSLHFKNLTPLRTAKTVSELMRTQCATKKTTKWLI